MADQVDVEDAFATIITNAIYPTPPATPTTPSPVLGNVVQIFRGWPKGQDLDAAMLANMTIVSIYPRGDTEVSDARYEMEWQVSEQPVHTISALVDNQGSRITFSGTPRAVPPQYVAVQVGMSDVYNYTLVENDTLDNIAASLAALIAVDHPGTTASGPVITIVGPVTQCRVGSTGTSWMEVGRQIQWFQIVVWAPSDEQRTAAVKLIDPMLREIRRMPLADGSVAGLRFVRTIVEDRVEKELIFRRDLIFSADYPTSVTRTDYEITSITENISPAYDPSAPHQSTI